MYSTPLVLLPPARVSLENTSITTFPPERSSTRSAKWWATSESIWVSVPLTAMDRLIF